MHTQTRLDRIDIAILAHLQQDSSLTNAALADKVNLSPSPCYIRVKRLEKNGYILRYSATLNIAKIAGSLTIYSEVELDEHRKESFQRFESTVRTYQDLQECHMVTGKIDYVLKFVCKSVVEYQAIMDELLQKNVGVARFYTFFVTRTVFQREGVDLQALLTPGNA
ncbi:Lrp/AsnC family transcriptional regulator [Pseudomonas reactans]|uniref:Lrp/AsnC family transcriptional regulator n=1 Tax=Pseudomonas reactans TaxID=117680 RepID=A0ABX2QXG3_9PSED|nr:Lrp/AsnC family transcriptional regulator [Pseudomonas reactans]NWA41129.1 Lrp/AsnC family transcriptional regulator [Pseudomonas reactans]NWC89702.1 Lrp/AsnC family transcriptional regulator [Pseudomonas reactans]NWD31959.1 Lrp/AsnC family transcriptional regulator [Pseudomonas reactans]NWD96507.1 Lrp/AsnC family transcriptional regulator [Pseudomonas reactans]NWF14665.1 Lrp/AsnC family transcriptional regulator [Pseudomonas reactans]